MGLLDRLPTRVPPSTVVNGGRKEGGKLGFLSFHQRLLVA